MPASTHGISYQPSLEKWILAPQIWQLFFFLRFYLSERGSKSTSRGKGRGRERSRLPPEQGAWSGAPSQDPGIMTWAEGRHLTDWATQEPQIFIFWKAPDLSHLPQPNLRTFGPGILHLSLYFFHTSSRDWYFRRKPFTANEHFLVCLPLQTLFFFF